MWPGAERKSAPKNREVSAMLDCSSAHPQDNLASTGWQIETPRQRHSGQHFVLALLPGYSVLSMTSFIETLSVANQQNGSAIFSWETCSVDGRAVASSSGLKMEVDRGIKDLCPTDMVLVCAGRYEAGDTYSVLKRWLRRCSRHGAKIGSLDCGSEVLAEAGLLVGKNTTLHWRRHNSFQERFPEVGLSRSSIVFESNTFSSSGGTSSIDLALCFIEKHAGQELAQRVTDELCYGQQRKVQELTNDTNPVFAQLGHPRLRQIIREMDAKIEEAPAMEYFAEIAGFSQRQMERLFLKHMGQTPKRFFNNMRLDRARNLLMQTEMSITEICVATGFGGGSFFARKFYARFGVTPHQFRNDGLNAGGRPSR